MKPDLVVRVGNKFILDERKILPYMKKDLDMVINALSIVCEDLKHNPQKFSTNSKIRLGELNSKIYDVLKEMNVYKE